MRLGKQQVSGQKEKHCGSALALHSKEKEGTLFARCMLCCQDPDKSTTKNQWTVGRYLQRNSCKKTHGHIQLQFNLKKTICDASCKWEYFPLSRCVTKVICITFLLDATDPCIHAGVITREPWSQPLLHEDSLVINRGNENFDKFSIPVKARKQFSKEANGPVRRE